MHAYGTVLRWPCGGRESGGRTRMRGPSEKNAQYWECAMRQCDDKLGGDARKQGSGIFFQHAWLCRQCAACRSRVGRTHALLSSASSSVHFSFYATSDHSRFFCLHSIGVLLNASAQLLLKAGVNAVGAFAFTRANIVPVGLKLIAQIPVIAGLVCYAASLMVWIMGLSRVDVSIAYPMLSLGYVVNALLAALFFGEALTLQRSAGILIILLGVYVLARSGG